MFTAKEFVGWYNGDTDYTDLDLDLGVETVAVVGQGNVALDCARILLGMRFSVLFMDISF